MKYLQITFIVCFSLILNSCFNVDEEEIVETEPVDSTFWSVESGPEMSFKSFAITSNNSVIIAGVRYGSDSYSYNYDSCGNQIGIVNLDSVFNYQNIGEPNICSLNEKVFVFFRYFYGLVLNKNGDVAKSISLDSDESTSYEEFNSVKDGGDGCLVETHIGYSEIQHGEEHFLTGLKLIRINQLGEVIWNKRIYSSTFSCIGTGLKSLVYSSRILHCLNKDGEKDWTRECDGVSDLLRLENGNVLLIKEDEIACITEENEIKWSTKGLFYDKFDALQSGGFIEHTYRDGKISIAKYDDNGKIDYEVGVHGSKYKKITLVNDSTLAVLSSNKFEILKIPN